MKFNVRIGLHYPSEDISEIKDRFKMVTLLCEKIPVNSIKFRDIKKLVNYLEKFLFYIHFEHDEYFKQKFNTFTIEYLRELIKKIIDTLNQSTGWSDWKWKRVEYNVKHVKKYYDVCNLDRVARMLIAKMSKIIAFARYQNRIWKQTGNKEEQEDTTTERNKDLKSKRWLRWQKRKKKHNSKIDFVFVYLGKIKFLRQYMLLKLLVFLFYELYMKNKLCNVIVLFSANIFFHS